MSRARILYFAEAVTLAHVARTLVLGEALRQAHDVTLALASHAHRLVPPERFELQELHSIPGSAFLRALSRGAPVYDEATLIRYVEEDLRLIDVVRPDLVVGDFRISLAVSARLRGTPYLNVTNAYWSPWYRQAAPLPVLPWTRIVPLPIARAVFALARGPAMAAHTVPMNRVRARFGLPGLGRDLRRVYSEADAVAYADVAELFPTPGAPASHQHIGPILWSPPDTPPDWWWKPPPGRSAYVTMGSSGDPAVLDGVVRALDHHGVSAMVATAGAPYRVPAGSLAQVAQFLPGIEAAKRADIVICNSGSMTVQQALAAGKPVLGIASNMDQFFNMRAVVDAGAGILVRADRASAAAVGAAALRLLDDPQFAGAAIRLSEVLGRYDAAARFRSMVAGILGAPTTGDLHREEDPA